ncbi:hypothetical protein TWF694_002192 [Orbilia ellipsospora]|uniref:WSC domain-containing protein n=1 Tax=Orbilia ellipsospora TaxID=2528407 RepID=A0AAV9X5Y0_9PEZI
MLREQWGWSQPYHWVTSDCGAVGDISSPHHFAADTPSAAAVALNAGTDLSCSGGTYTQLTASIARGETSENIVDQSLSRLYLSLLRLGYFDTTNGRGRYKDVGWVDVNTDKAQNLAYEAAVQGFVLLKNDGSLPFAKNITTSKVALIGPWGAATDQLKGNYAGTPPFLVSPLAAFSSKWNVTYVQGAAINSADTSGFAQALLVAKQSDYIIYAGGIDDSIEAEGRDRSSIAWPGNQLNLISQLAALNKTLVVLQFGGGQLDDSALLSNKGVNSLLWAGYPSQSGGDALRDILDGTRVPAGRLPITQYPANYTTARSSILNPNLRPDAGGKYPGQTYKWYDGAVLPFGYGLHYTPFKLSWSEQPLSVYSTDDIQKVLGVDVADLVPLVSIAVNIQNTGKYHGSDFVALVFLSTSNAGPAPYPKKTLAAYGRASNVRVGKTQTLTFTIPLKVIARADSNGNLVVYPGDYTLVLDVDNQQPVSFKIIGNPITIEKVPVPPSKPVAIEYLGCYKDTSGGINTGTSTNLSENSPQNCADSCMSSGYGISGVEQGTVCLCAKTFSKAVAPVDDSYCNSGCPEFPEATCGGSGYVAVYNNSIPVTWEAPTWSP